MTTTDGRAATMPAAPGSHGLVDAPPADPPAAADGATPAPALPAPPPVGRARRALRAVRAGRVRAPSTPFLLRLGMALACLPVVVFATAVQMGIERNDSTVRTVGSEATRGITYAQALKVDLADLDEVVVHDLLDGAPPEANGLPGDYNAKRAELHDNLVLAALVSSSGAAYEQPLANIDYVLSHYHTLVKDAFAAMLVDDTAGAVDDLRPGPRGDGRDAAARGRLRRQGQQLRAQRQLRQAERAVDVDRPADRGVVARPAGLPRAGPGPRGAQVPADGQPGPGAGHRGGGWPGRLRPEPPRRLVRPPHQGP